MDRLTEKLILNFSVKTIGIFFKKASSVFAPERENSDDLLENKNLRSFADLERFGSIAFPDTGEPVVIACLHGGNLSARNSKK